jgi:hypothetical protein
MPPRVRFILLHCIIVIGYKERNASGDDVKYKILWKNKELPLRIRC